MTGIKFVNTTGSAKPPDIRVGYGALDRFVFGQTQPVPPPTTTFFQAPVEVALQKTGGTAGMAATVLPDGDLKLSYPPNGFTTGTSTSTLFETLVHEIGHALGLAHNLVDPYSVMFSAAYAAAPS